jgi:hypothetical protein
MYNVYTALFYLYDKQEYRKKFWIIRPTEAILEATHQESWMSICQDDIKALGASNVHNKSSQMGKLLLMNKCSTHCTVSIQITAKFFLLKTTE